MLAQFWRRFSITGQQELFPGEPNEIECTGGSDWRGGVIGCSILYHLTKLGWKDVILLERDELTSGSTWHAAANIHGLHDNNNISRIQHYTMNLYKELEEVTGQGCGVFQPGSLYLAQTEEREHQLRLQEAKAQYYGLDFHEVNREEAEKLHPLVNFDGIRCIMWEPSGGIAGDFTITKLDDEEFLMVGSGMAERYHARFFSENNKPDTVTFESRTEAMCGFNVAGPKSRDLLQRLTNDSLETEDFPFMRSKRVTLAGIDMIALRVSFTGDLGWELHCNTEDQAELYSALIEAGKEFGAGPVGSRALMSLRIEKGYGSWSREYSPEYWPQEVGLDGLCKMAKEFLNKGAAVEVMQNSPCETLVLMALDEAAVSQSNADATGGEPIFKGGKPVGRVTSGTYGYTVGKSLALGFVKDVVPGETVEVMVLGMPHPAVVLEEPPFDPKGEKLRA